MSPAAVARILREGRLPTAMALVALATAISVAHVMRFAGEVAVEDVMFGPGRSPLVGVLLGALGTELTSVVLYLFQSSWTALLVVGALSPPLIWALGSTAIHGAARLAGIRMPFVPYLVFFGYAIALTRPLADLPPALLGTLGPAGAIAQATGTAALVWLAVIAWQGIREHYSVDGSRALTILAVAVAIFYLAPITLVLLALVAIIVAAIVLEYAPAR